MAEDRYERQRREQELEQRRQEESRERAHFQRTRCTSCGLVAASIGSYCSLCAPSQDRETEYQGVDEPKLWAQRLIDDGDLEQERIADALEDQRFRRTRCTSCGLMSATIGSYCSQFSPEDLYERVADKSNYAGRVAESGYAERAGDESDYFRHLLQALEDGMPVEKHHVFPQAKEFREKFAGKIDIHQYTVPLPRDWHVQLTRSWHLEWRWFFDQYPNPKPEEIERQGAEMMSDYGFLQAIFVHYDFPMYE